MKFLSPFKPTHPRAGLDSIPLDPCFDRSSTFAWTDRGDGHPPRLPARSSGSPHWTRKVSLVVAILLMLFKGSAAGTEKVVRMAVGEWPPYLSKSIEGDGLVAAHIRHIFAREGYTVKFIFLPWARVITDTRNGNFECTGVWLKTEERVADFYYSEFILKEKHVLFYLREKPFDWKSVADLKSKSIGGIISFYYGKEFAAAEARGDLTIQRVTSDVQNFKKLLSGRVEIYPQELNVGLYTLKTNFTPGEVSRVAYHPKVLMEKKSYVLFPKSGKRSAKLLDIFNKGLKRMQDSCGQAGNFEYNG